MEKIIKINKDHSALNSLEDAIESGLSEFYANLQDNLNETDFEELLTECTLNGRPVFTYVSYDLKDYLSYSDDEIQGLPSQDHIKAILENALKHPHECEHDSLDSKHIHRLDCFEISVLGSVLRFEYRILNNEVCYSYYKDAFEINGLSKEYPHSNVI